MSVHSYQWTQFEETDCSISPKKDWTEIAISKKNDFKVINKPKPKNKSKWGEYFVTPPPRYRIISGYIFSIFITNS